MRALVMFGDSERSMDLFHAVPRAIIDPFLYVEGEGRRIAVAGHIDHESIREADAGIELLDPCASGAGCCSSRGSTTPRRSSSPRGARWRSSR